MRVPNIHQAEALLEDGARRNPGAWVAHSRVAGETARAIASHVRSLDPDAAHVLGMLHDIGRGEAADRRPEALHITDGYRLLMERGFDDCARVCLTHSFPINDADAYSGTWPESTLEDKRFVEAFLRDIEYTPYDRLVQLCDALSMPHGPVLLEKRLFDVVLRHGFNALTVRKWQAFLSLLKEFDQAVGGSVYALLPEVESSTFQSA